MKPKRSNPLFAGFFRANSLASAVVLTLAGLASQNSAFAAAQVYQDASALNTWNTTDTNWDAGVVWTDGNDAVFGGTGEAVTVGTVTANAITFNSSGYTLGSGTLTLGAAATPITTNADAIINSVLAIGTNGFSKAGTGVLTLGGANTGTGAISISQGTLKLGVAGALGTSSLVTVSSGATLDVAGLAGGRPVSVSGTGNGTNPALWNSATAVGGSVASLKLDNNATAGNASTNRSFLLTIAGLADLNGKKLTINAGAVSLGLRNITSGDIEINSGGTLYSENGGTQSSVTGTITINTGGVLDFRDADNTAMTSLHTITLNGGKLGNGVITNNNGGGGGANIKNNISVNNVAGNTLAAVSSGFGNSIKLNGSVSGTGALSIQNNGVEFRGDTSGYTGTATATSGTVTFNPSAATQTFGGVIAGSRPLAKNGTNTTILAGGHTFTGKTSINAGTLSVSSLNYITAGSLTPNTSSSLGKPTTAANGTIGLGSLTNTGTLLYSGTGETTDRVIDLAGTTGGGVVDQSGTGLLKFTSANTAATRGTKTLTLQGSTAGTGEISGAIADGVTGSTALAATYATGATNITLASVTGISVGAAISGTGIPAAATVTAVNTSTRVVTISAATTAANNTLGSTITVTGVTNPTLLAKAGTGTWTLSGANTFSGSTTINGGTLNLDYTAGSTSKLSDTGALVFNGVSSLTLNNGTNPVETVGSTTLNSGSTATVSAPTGGGVLQMNAITRNAGATISFAASGIATTDTLNDASGILGTWATIGSDFATNSTNSADGLITAYSAYADVTRLESGPKAITDAPSSIVRITEGTGTTLGDITLATTPTNITHLVQSTVGGASNASIALASQKLRLGAAGSIITNPGSGSLTVGTSASSGTLTAGGAADNLAGTIDIVGNGSNPITINSVVANNGTGVVSLNKIGSGTAILAGANTYTGGTTLANGILKVSNSGGLGTTASALALSGGTTLELASDTAVTSRAVTLNGSTAVILDRATAGAGLTTSFAALTFADSHTLTVTKGANVSSGNATLNFTGFPALGAAGKVAGFDIGAGALVNITGSITGTQAFARVTKSGAGTLVLSGNNDYWDPASSTGLITVNAGTLDLRHQNAIGDGGTGANSIALSMAASTTLRLGTDTSLANNADLTLTGSGVTIVSDRNTSGAGITNQFDVLSIGTQTLGVSGGSNIASGTTQVNFNSATLSGSPTFDVSQPASGITNLRISGVVSGGTGLTKSGTGMLTLGGNNTYGGATAVNGGTLRVTNTAGSATGAGAVALNSGTLDGSGSISGTVTVAAGGTVTAGAAGSGNLTVGSLTFDGTATVNVTPGTNRIDVTNALTASGSAGSVTVNLTGAQLPPGTYTLISHPAGVIGGTGFPAFVKGTTPGGNFTYTLVDIGTELQVTVASSGLVWSGATDSEWSTGPKTNWTAGGSPTNFVNNSDVLFDDSATTTNVDISVSDVAPTSIGIFNSNGFNYTFTGDKSITGATSLVKTGNGIATLSNTNSFTGEVTVSQGILEAETVANSGTNSAIGSGTKVSIAAGTFSYIGITDAGTNREVALTTSGSSGSVDVLDSATTLTLSGPVTGAGNFNKSGTGTLVLTGTNTYTGTSTVSTGILTVGDGGSTGVLGGTGTVTVSSGAILAYNHSVAQTLSRAVNGSGTLVKKGAEKLTVNTAGSIILPNHITVEAGSMEITTGSFNTDRMTGSNGLVTVNAGATLTLSAGHSLGGDNNGMNDALAISGTLTLDREQYITTLTLEGGTINGTNEMRVPASGNYTVTGTAASTVSARVNQGFSNANWNVADVTGTAAPDLTVSGQMTNNFGFIKTGAGTMRIANTSSTTPNNYTGNTVVNAGTLELADDAQMKFVIPATGNANRLSGTGSVQLDGDFNIDTTAAASLTSGSWNLVDVATLTETFGTSFSVIGFTDAGGGKWTKSTAGGKIWTFDEATGTLTLAVGGYDSWASGYNLTGNDALRTSDPDTDGFTNLQEFLFGTNPTTSTGSLTSMTSNGSILTIRWSERTSGATYQLLESATLANPWSLSGTTPSNDGPVSGDYQPRKAEVTIGAGKNFFRIEGVEN